MTAADGPNGGTTRPRARPGLVAPANKVAGLSTVSSTGGSAVPACVRVCVCVSARAGSDRRRGPAFAGSLRTPPILTVALAGVDVLEVARVAVQLGGALLARVAPGAAHGGAAELLGAHDALQLAVARVLRHLGVARPGAVVCETGNESNGNANTAFLNPRLSKPTSGPPTCFAAPAAEAVDAGAAVRADAAAAVEAWLLADGWETSEWVYGGQTLALEAVAYWPAHRGTQ